MVLFGTTIGPGPNGSSAISPLPGISGLGRWNREPAQRLAAVRRLAYEAADSGLLSPELAAGIRRVKGAKQLGTRTGNWLTQDQARLLLQKADGEDLRSIRDLAMISVLVGCGLRRAELSALKVRTCRFGKGTGASWT